MYIKPESENKVVSGLPQVRQIPAPLIPYQVDNRIHGNLPPVHQDNVINPRDIVAKIWRGKWIILLTMFVIMILTLAFLKVTPPKYSSRALVMIGGSHQLDLNMSGAVPTLKIGSSTLYNEVEVLRSYSLASKVFDGLKLDTNPEFNPELKEDGNGGLSALFAKLRSSIPFLNSEGTEDVSQLVSPEQKRATLIKAFQKNQSLGMLDKSMVLEVKYMASDPELAAVITNTYVDTYINSQIESKFNITNEANDWLDVRVQDLRTKVKEAETSIEEYRQSHGLLQTATGATVYSQQLSELNTQLIIAGTERAEKEVRLEQARSLGSNIGSASEIIGSEMIRRLQEQESTIDRKLAELSTSYGAKHPSVVNVEAERKDIRGKIASESRKILKGLSNEASISRSRENALRSRLSALENKLASSNSQEVKLRALEREAEASRNLLNTFLARYNETDSQKDLDIQKPDAKVVSYATPATDAAFPKKGPILVMALFGSVLIGLVAVFLRELFDKGFRSGVQIEQHTGLPSLGMVPALGKLHAHFAKPESFVLKDPTSEFSEAIRAIHTNMLFTKLDERVPKIVQFTSAYPGEGKSTIARCLAILKRQAGVKTIIIDANLRSPTLHKSFNTPQQPGLAEYLSGMAALHEIIAKDKKSGTYLIPAGLTKRSPTDLLPSRRLDDLFNDLSEDFDLIIVDSPAVLTVPDARILASRVDMSVVVIKWADTSEEVVEYALKQLSESGAPRMSTVLSMVDSKKHAQYNFADSGLYARSMR